ncbi:glycine betaine ABC transporter substrate-binding protein [Dongia sp.]|uniref:glycine betaine ABC transporter substrate-binding protein n=1 Tax=Dongia sp. TaxID=1977262 RepID=UPI0035AF8936
MSMRKLLATSAMSLVAVVAAQSGAQATDGESCKTIRVPSVGWTDNDAINGLFSTVVKPLGYETQMDVLGFPIVLEGMKNKDIDIFLDNWMPSQSAEITPFLDDKSVVTVGANLEGAGYGPVVPTYVADAGVKDLKDLGGANTEKFEGKFYGIEPGNDGNRIVQGKIDDPANGLDGWEVVESSEQGMLVQAEKAIKNNEYVAFLAWTPHPIMGKMPLHYLTGFEADGFGPATIYTVTRAGYSEECPNVGALLKNLKFSLEQEGAIMEAILGGKDGETAAKEWLVANPAVLDTWLAGVKTLDGQDGLPAVKAALGL